MERVKGYLRQGMKTVISIAPSYLGVLEYKNPGQVVDALLKLGFLKCARRQRERRLSHVNIRKLLEEGTMKNLITTCCPSVNDPDRKILPSLTKYMTPVVSPMIAHGRLIKKIYGEDVKVVFFRALHCKKRRGSWG